MKNLRSIFITVIVLLSCQGFNAQNKRLISGTVIDVSTKEPLPYVTISLKKLLIGVVTNEAGKFDLYVPADVSNDTVLVSYLGYKHRLIGLKQIESPALIQLESTVVQLEEIVVRPLTPENYIQIAMRKVGVNYPGTPFQTVAYYREKVMENKNLVQCDEGIFKTYTSNYLDTARSQHQLMLFRRAENTEPIQFMQKEIKEKQTKDSIKTANGKESKTVIDVGESFGGPADILKSGNISKKQEAFLDTLQLKSYKYSFSRSSSYNTNELIVIDFASRGKVNHLRESGKIYIDLHSQAIVKIEVAGDLVIPVIIKPILFFLSIGVKNPRYEKSSEFQQVNGKWYPKNIHETMHIILTNNHLFRADEHSDFEIEQFFTVNELKTEHVTEIPKEKRFKEGKEMDKQVFNDSGLSWDGMNIIKK